MLKGEKIRVHWKQEEKEPTKPAHYIFATTIGATIE